MDDTIDNSTYALTSTSKLSNSGFVRENHSNLTKLQRNVCFRSRLWLKHKHFCGPTAQITDPAELTIAKDKLLLLTQSEFFPVEFIQQQSRVETSSRIASYSSFISPGGIIRSTGWIERLAEINFGSQQPIILDSRSIISEIVSEPSKFRPQPSIFELFAFHRSCLVFAFGFCCIGSEISPPCN